jgi:pimeloyl-ACP methyl ester carboxylesterase
VLTPGRHQVEFDGIAQAYEVAGQGPVCFVHSGLGDESDYLRIPLLERHMTMIYLDPVGTGESDRLPGGDYSVAEYARRFELLRDRLGITDGFLLGHAHGGFVAMQHALDYPGRVRGLIIYDGAPVRPLDLHEEFRRRAASFAERWPDRPEVAAAVRALNQRDRNVHDALSAQEYQNMVRPLYFADYRKTVSELGGPPTINVSYDPDRKPYTWDAQGRLGAIEVPVLVLVGTHDLLNPPVRARQISKEITNSRLAEFTESGHLAHWEEPEKFSDTVDGFVAEVNQTGDIGR